MRYITGFSKTGIRLAAVGLIAILAACGGKSEQEQACEAAADGILPILNGIQCLTGAAGEPASKPADSGVTAIAYDSSDFAEYEPNTTLDNANPISMGSAGLTIGGQVSAGDDQADHFVFSPQSGGEFSIYLCAATCDSVLQTDALSLMVLDQSQTTMAGTAVGGNDEQTLDIHLEAGMAYYVSVTGISGSDPYRLVIAPSGQ